ncbi:MAG: 50S ribosomal protein L32 [Nitrospirae bacterium]|nr:50S ribosomal protein L32 [Nitrospirota bacterium]
MPNPKRKISKTRRDKRRTHFKLHPPTPMECPRCHEKRLSHHACPHCGYYRDREVLRVEEI